MEREPAMMISSLAIVFGLVVLVFALVVDRAGRGHRGMFARLLNLAAFSFLVLGVAALLLWSNTGSGRR